MFDTLVTAFYANEAYYRVVHMGKVDNPDQRITQDVSQFVDSSASVLNALVSRVFSVCAFSGASSRLHVDGTESQLSHV